MINEITPQICGLVIDVLLLVFYMINKNLKIYRERLFYACLVITTLSVIADIFSIICIYYSNVFNETFTKIICKTYLVTLICCSFSTLFYVLSYVLSKKTHKSNLIYAYLALLIFAVAIYVLPISLVNKNEAVYTEGLAVLLTYIFCCLGVVSTITFTIIFNKKIKKRRTFAILLWMGIWIAGALFQFFNNEITVVGFCASVGILIQCTIVENPEGNIDKEYGCFNSYALEKYIDSLVEDDVTYSAIEIYLLGLDNARAEEEKNRVKQNAYSLISEVNKNKNIYIFKSLGSGFIVLFKNLVSVEKVSVIIKDLLKNNNLLNNNVCITLLKDAYIFTKSIHLQSFFDYIKANYEYGASRIYYATEDISLTYSSRYSISNIIDKAIKEDRVEVFFQPIYSNKDKLFTSAEALVRIRNKDGTLLPPGEFIPVAEETGQIAILSKIIFNKICKFISESGILSYGINTIDFNLSVSECRNIHLADDLIRITKKYNVDPKHIILELTETAQLDEKVMFIKNMQQLIEYGFVFALDDFGKGESNLGYIMEMPVSTIKFDFDFTKSFFKNNKAKAIITSMISMAHDMDLKVVSEGVESKEEKETFELLGVDYIQGFYYSGALSSNDFINFIADHNHKHFK